MFFVIARAQGTGGSRHILGEHYVKGITRDGVQEVNWLAVDTYARICLLNLWQRFYSFRIDQRYAGLQTLASARCPVSIR